MNIFSYYSVFPFGIRTSSESIYPDVYAGPSFSDVQASVKGLCNSSDPIDSIFRSDKLNYVTASGLTTFDQADNYLMNINNAYSNYLATLQPYAVLTAPSVIQGILTYYTAQVQSVSTRIYYQLFGNTSQPLDAFNFQIQFTPYKVIAPSNLSPLLRSRSISGRVVNLNALNVALVKLPSIAIENTISFDQTSKLVNSLVSSWQLSN